MALQDHRGVHDEVALADRRSARGQGCSTVRGGGGEEGRECEPVIESNHHEREVGTVTDVMRRSSSHVQERRC